MSVVHKFLKWMSTAKVSERSAAAVALARAYLYRDLPFEERYAAEAALTLLLDDPSAKVRQALAEAMSLSHHAPLQIVSTLAADQPEVAAPILVRSPLLTDYELIDLVGSGEPRVQQLIAMRARVSMALSASIAEVGTAEACLELVGNSGAEIAALSFRRMVERHGDHAGLREALIADARLPSDCRYMLLMRTGEALRNTPLVRALMGPARAEKLTKDACSKASITLIEGTRADEHEALVEHLRLCGDLTPSFIVRAVAHGKIDFFGAVLVALTRQSRVRVKALLAGGREAALCALFREAGLGEAVHAPLLRALGVWREVAAGKRLAGPQEVSWLMLAELDAAPGQKGPAPECAELAGLLKSIHLEALRRNARCEALTIAAA